MNWFSYLRLLLWKNFLIKSRHKAEVIVEILFPVIFLGSLVGIRSVILPTRYDEPTLFQPVSIGASSLDTLRTNYSMKVELWEIDYYPYHPLLESLVAKATSDLNLDSYRGFNSSEDFMRYMLQKKSFVGVVFDVTAETLESGYPNDFTYSLRFPGALRTVDLSATIPDWDTDTLFPSEVNGARKQESNLGGNPGYIVEGFIAVQNAISSNYIKLAGNHSEIPGIELQRLPYPPYVYDPLIESMQQTVGVMIILAFMFPIVQGIKHITVEKERQLKEAMKIMGLSTSHHWVAWFLTLFSQIFIVFILLMVCLRVPFFDNSTVAVFSNSSWSVLVVFFFIYSMTSITFCFMISSFFAKASIAGPVSALSWFVTYIPFTFIMNGVGIPFGANVGLSFFSNTACCIACKLILNWEEQGIGTQWSNLFEYPNIANEYSVGMAGIMLIVDGVLYMLIALYFEKVMPGADGVAYKWYFPLTKSFWCKSSYYSVEDDMPPASPGAEDDRFEPETDRSKVGIQLINLKKRFGSKLAVDGMSMKMYENQITVLLGHNGAGKTTTISMITGFLSPTSGTAIISGYNMKTDFNSIRKNLGFCPQYNILFDELTVEEHIRFYSQLKGTNPENVEEDINKYLKILGLEDKRKAQAGTLSGGMKRKLSIGISLCGDSKIVVCDEPSAGMDPAARRSLWELLQNEKKRRTILLTTHMMDEADVLGDRIAIMSAGKLQCSGTPFFLKKRFGTGYKLICSKRDQCDTNAITSLIREYIPEATIKSEVGTELTFQLPEKYSNVFEPVLRKLENSQKHLGVNGYGISMTTLEDVFLRTGAEIDNGSKNGSENGSTAKILVDHVDLNNMKLVSAGVRFRYQWYALFYKKIINFIRNWHLFIIQLGVPIIFILMGFFVSKTSNAIGNLPPLTMNLNDYPGTVTLFRNEAQDGSLENSIAQNYKNLFALFNADESLQVISQSVEEAFVDATNGDLKKANQEYMIAATVASNQLIAWFNNQGLHTAPLTLNLLYNAIARTMLGNNYKITVINAPLPLTANFQLNDLESTNSVGVQLAMNTTFAMAYVSSIFIMFLITERVSKSKLLQFISGVSGRVYWITHFLFDYLVYTVIAIVIVFVILALQQDGFNTFNELGRLFLIFMVYGFAALPLTYLVSFFFEEPATGLARLSIIHVFTGDALFITAYILSALNLGDTLQKVGVIFPNFALAQAISNQAMLEQTKGVCSSIAKQMGLSLDNLCFMDSSTCCDLNPFGWGNLGIAEPLVAMFAVGLGLFVLVLFHERRINSPRSSCCSKKTQLPQESNAQYDDDVENEKFRIAHLQPSDIAKRNLVMRDLTKYYKKFLAVNRVSVGIDKGECFGLLGVNGAGKTSTFKMMTGDESVSCGDVWIEGRNVQTERSSIYDLIGYCPQYDALLMDFTGLEVLEIFATLRGVPRHLVKPLSEKLAEDLTFDKHLHKKVKEYSGGNRRKLSTALALLGDPHLIFLDEPTAGVDPSSRRKLWDVICQFRDMGKAIVLTSHSMEECEALCTRLAIMVNGEFKCIGSSQHLKNKYSPGITLTIKLGSVDNASNLPKVDYSSFERPSFELDEIGFIVFTFINQNFPGAKLKDYHKKLLTFDLPGNIMPYSRIFGLMESSKKALYIEDYSLSQGTLEQVFLSFTNNQRGS